jgi:hypothetical protein
VYCGDYSPSHSRSHKPSTYPHASPLQAAGGLAYTTPNPAQKVLRRLVAGVPSA